MSRLQIALREVFGEMNLGTSDYKVPWSNLMSFLPHPRVGQGDFSSSAALMWAAQSRTSAPELAEQFIAMLSQRVPGEWYEDNGFIVVKGDSSEWWYDELRTVKEVSELILDTPPNQLTTESPLSVNVIPPADELPLYAGLRLLALGGVQAFFIAGLGAPCSLSFLGEIPSLVTTPSQVATLFENAVRELLQDGISRKTLTHKAWKGIERIGREGDTGALRFLWVAHHTSSAADPDTKNILAQCRSVPGYSVRMPNDGWLIRGYSDAPSDYFDCGP